METLQENKPRINLGDRMKTYERNSKKYLENKKPVIIRVDGKAFHSFTKHLRKPFDEVLEEAMLDTAEELCKNVMNCKMAYTQSDEISLVLVDYLKEETEPWFKNNVQKMASVAASMATLYFNTHFTKRANKYYAEVVFPKYMNNQKLDMGYLSNLMKCCNVGAMFDARVFTLPSEDEAVNYFIWRQQDAIRNSIQSFSRAFFSDKEMFKKNTSELKQMLIEQKGFDWEKTCTTAEQRGSCIIKTLEDDGTCGIWNWTKDESIPIFSSNKEYITSRLSI